MVRYSFDADAKSVARRLGDAKKSFLVSRDCVGIAHAGYAGRIGRRTEVGVSVCQHTNTEDAASSNVPALEMETSSEV